MNVATYWKCEDVLRRPVTVEWRKKRDAGHAETHSMSSTQPPKGGWKDKRSDQRPILAKSPVSESQIAALKPIKTKRKKAS